MTDSVLLRSEKQKAKAAPTLLMEIILLTNSPAKTIADSETGLVH